MKKAQKPRTLNSVSPFAGRVGVDEMQLALETSDIGVWNWNIVTGEVAWSDNLERIHGRAPGSFDAYLADIYADDRDAVLASIDRAVSEGHDHDAEYRIVLPDASLRWVASRGRVFADAAGRPVRMIGTCQDVTRRRDAEDNQAALRRDQERLTVDLALAREQLALETDARWRAEDERRAAEGRLREHQKLDGLGRLAAGVAHDFNNLLSIILGTSELVLRHLDQGHPIRPRIDEIQKAAGRGSALTRRLLSLSRPAEPELRVADINATLAETSAMLGRLVGDDVDIICLRDSAPCPVRIDPGQVDHMLLNLVVNARDAMPEGGRIVVETRAFDTRETVPCIGAELGPGRYVTVSVTDTGCGIDPATLGRIFEAFFTTKERERGTGLGLSTVYALVREAGGAVRVTSTTGRGTTFTILLPRAESEAEQEETGTPQARGCGTSIVLLFEPDDDLRSLLREIVESAGHEVIEARDRREVVRVCGDPSLWIDLIVADAPPPRPGSRPLVDTMRALRPGIPVVLLTDAPDAGIAEHMSGGQVVTLAKPVNADELLRRVECVMAPDQEL